MSKILEYIKLKIIKNYNWRLESAYYSDNFVDIYTVDEAKLLRFIQRLQLYYLDARSMVLQKYFDPHSIQFLVKNAHYKRVYLSFGRTKKLIDFINKHNLNIDCSLLDAKIKKVSEQYNILADMKDSLPNDYSLFS